jgi:hypothetical protein
MQPVSGQPNFLVLIYVDIITMTLVIRHDLGLICHLLEIINVSNGGIHTEDLCFDWKVQGEFINQPLLTYAPSCHSSISWLWRCQVGSLEWHTLFFMVIISIILVLLITFARKLAYNLVSIDLLCIGYGT